MRCGKGGLKQLVASSDILVSLLPLTIHTNKLIDREVMQLMPKGAAIINFSRGAVLDTLALMSMLDCGHLSHAVLDVFEQEPLAVGSELWHHPGITVLPHISAPTNRQTACRLVAENISAYRKTGVIPDTVDKGKGY